MRWVELGTCRPRLMRLYASGIGSIATESAATDRGLRFCAVWGWKDPRNSLTLPFWQDLVPGLKTLIMVRNPLEVAYSMRERNGTSYAFGLRLWEIYNRRLIEAAGKHDRLVTHYDLVL